MLTFDEFIENEKKYLKNCYDNLKTIDGAIAACKSQNYLDKLTIRKKDLLNRKRIHEFRIRYAREYNAIDYDYRMDLIKNYKYRDLIREAIPDDYPIVFHGTTDLGNIKSIIECGGLFTAEERGVSHGNALNIDVTNKFNISVTLDYADLGKVKYLPYGAIFAFMPQKDEEYEVLLADEDAGQVINGVQGVSFRNEPDRLVAIITTPENIELISSWCKENGIDSNKVCNHYEFLERMRKKER